MKYKVEKVKPYSKSDSKNHHSKNHQMMNLFNSIAPSYDCLCDTLSLGFNSYWQRDALKWVKHYPHDRILDIATGTGSFAIAAQKVLKPSEIIAADISWEMMKIGQQKVMNKGLSDKITFEQQDCAKLTYGDNCFDVVTTSYGIRNYADIDKSFQEILRVLKPGGVFLAVELTNPETAPMRQLHSVYCKLILPKLSNLICKDRYANKYLPESVAVFPQGRELMLMLKKNGFVRIRLRRYMLGVATVYMAEKPVV